MHCALLHDLKFADSDYQTRGSQCIFIALDSPMGFGDRMEHLLPASSNLHLCAINLHAELEHRRELYIAAAVTEIATLRAELFGPQVG